MSGHAIERKRFEDTPPTGGSSAQRVRRGGRNPTHCTHQWQLETEVIGSQFGFDQKKYFFRFCQLCGVLEMFVPDKGWMMLPGSDKVIEPQQTEGGEA